MQIDEILNDLQSNFRHLIVKKTWGETSLFFNPNDTSPHGSYFLTIKERDGENDQASLLDRDGVFRVSFGVSRNTYENLFGAKPHRPAKGEVVHTGHDFAQINQVMPHPIYAWMNWLQILNPSEETWSSIQNLLRESYQLAKSRFEKR